MMTATWLSLVRYSVVERFGGVRSAGGFLHQAGKFNAGFLQKGLPRA